MKRLQILGITILALGVFLFTNLSNNFFPKNILADRPSCGEELCCCPSRCYTGCFSNCNLGSSDCCNGPDCGGPVPTDPVTGLPIPGGGECRCEDNIECFSGYREYDGQETTLYLSVKDKESAVPNPYIEYKRSGNGQAANNVIVDVGDTIYFYPSPAFRRVATYNITLGNYGACGWPWWDAAKTSWSCPYSIVIGSAAFQGTVTAFQ